MPIEQLERAAVGRPITRAADPLAVLDRINAEIADAGSR